MGYENMLFPTVLSRESSLVTANWKFKNSSFDIAYYILNININKYIYVLVHSTYY